jgi:hypothetical protein
VGQLGRGHFGQVHQDVDYFDKPVTFTFSWVNQTGQSNLFTVNALLGVTATCDVTADSNWWPLTIVPPSSTLDVVATLGITMVADDGQVIEPPLQPSQSQQVLDLFVDSSWLSGTINGKDVFGTYILQYSGLYLPANGQVEFDLNCEVSWLAVDGGCGFVAAGHGRQVTAPGVIISTQPWVIT